MWRKGRFNPVLWLGLVTLAVVAIAVGLMVGTVGARLVDSTLVDGAVDVPVTLPIRLTFSQAVDPSTVEAHWHMEPGLEGRFSSTGNEITFVPHGSLSPNTAYTVILDAGVVSLNGRTLSREHVWRFRTRSPELLYLGYVEPESSIRQIFAVNVDTGESRRLTGDEFGVWDYAVHPQGDAIVYSVLRADGGTDLWRMDRDGRAQRLLLPCPEASCMSPAWSPDGQWLAYERRDLWADAPNLDSKAGRIWLLDLTSAKERPLFDYDVATHSPAWSPDGTRLAYVSPLLPGLEVLVLETEELQQFGNDWGGQAVWSPDGDYLVTPELMLAGESLVVRLIRIDLAEESVLDISGDEDFVKDASPAWSPGGGWIAFGRQYVSEEQWTPGRQLWLTRPDASEAFPLLQEPMADLFGFVWRPDGGALAYLRSELSEGLLPMPEVSVWVFDLERREPARVADGAVLPKWLP